MVYGLGMLESGVHFDCGQLVLDNEIAKMTKFMIGGIPVTDDAMALDVIDAVGPFGEFVSNRHTFKNFKAASTSLLINRYSRAAWEKDGSKSMYQASEEMAQKILKEHQVAEVPAGVRQELAEILKEAEADLAADLKK